MNRRLQCLSLFFLPFFLSAILLLVYLQARSRLETTRKDQGRESWGREAKSALTHLEAGHTIESQIDTMGIGLNERLRRLWGWSGLSDSDLAGQELVEAFRLAFPARHRPVGTLLYGFKVDERGRVVFLRGKKLSVGLGQGRERILAGLLEGFLAMGKDDGRARENSPGGGILSPAMLGSRCRGLFGRKVTPGLVGVEGRGRLVPVEMGGVSREPGFLLWNFIGFQGGNVGGYVIFFPRNLSRQARPLSFCLEKIARESGGRLLPMLVPVNPLLPLRKALIHPDCRKIPGLREFLARMLPYVDRESAFPVNRLFLGEGVWAMRRFFSLDRPYEGWVVGRDPLARAPVMKNRRQVAWLVFLGAWGLILSPFLIRGTVPEISIRRTFPLFFFLVAAVPLAMRFSLESHQIEAGRFRQVAEMGDAALDEIRGVDGEFSEVISDFTQDSRALLSRPGWLARLASVDPGVECEAASEAFRIFSSSTIRLDLLLVYKPGKIPRGYSTDPELSRRDRTGLDFFAPAGQEIIRRCELDRPSGQIFPLSENQQKFARTVERRGIAPSGGLKGSTETGSIVRITGSWRYLTFSQTYSEKGRVKVFFILASKAEPVFSRFLRERVAGMSLASPKDRFLLGSFLPGNEEVILPPFGNSYWGTQAGRKMRQIMIRSSNFRAPILLERPDHLLVVRGCPNLGDFVVGREISLADLNGQVRWQWLVLIMGVLLLAGIALLLGQATIAFLIEPMTAVERGLRELIHGRQPPPLALPRQDELGEVTRSFDSMVTGLGRRVKLGLFVSGSLEESLELGVDGALAGECSPARGVVLASDLRNFTTISETHSPEVVVDMLNQHLEAMSEAIKRHGGRIDKFIGDAIIAVFTGNPGDDPAARAVAAGLEMRRGHEALQAERRAHGLFTYEMGVGIDGGDLFVGTIGTHGRSEFTVFGPPREAAEALESASKKGTGTRVMISARIRDEAGTRFRCTAHGAGVFEVIGPAGQEGGDL